MPEPTAEELRSFINRIKEAIDAANKGDDMSVLRCKMRVSQVLHQKDVDGSTSQEQVKLTAVYGEAGTANAQWSKWTPSANFDIYINNPSAFSKLSAGHEFYVDFTPAEVEESVKAQAATGGK